MLNQANFDTVLNLYNSYSDDQKVELFKLLYFLLPQAHKEMAKNFLVTDKQLEVNFGKCQVSAKTFYQVNLQSADQMADVLSAIAAQIRSET